MWSGPVNEFKLHYYDRMIVACNKNFNVLSVNQYVKVTYMEKSCIK